MKLIKYFLLIILISLSFLMGMKIENFKQLKNKNNEKSVKIKEKKLDNKNIVNDNIVTIPSIDNVSDIKETNETDEINNINNIDFDKAEPILDNNIEEKAINEFKNQ